MILVCNPSLWGGEHAPVDAGILATVRASYPDEEIYFFGEQTHIEQIQDQLGPAVAASISWRAIVPASRRARYFRRLFRDVKILRNLLPILRQNRGNLLLTVCPSTFLAALKVFAPGDLPVQAVLHKVSSLVNGRRSRHPIRRIRQIRTTLTVLCNRKIQYLVLEESLREAILERYPSLAGRIEVLEHPLPVNEGGIETVDLHLPIRLGFLGLVSEDKGFSLFTRVASEAATKYGGRVEFHAIGRFSGNANLPPGIESLATKPGLERLSRSDFVEGVKRLHFIVCPHQVRSYRSSASGTLVDAIAWGKPLIAARIPIFESMFDRFGDIGYLFRDELELREIIEKIVTGVDRKHYLEQVHNIQKAKATRTPRALAPAYRQLRERVISQC